MLLSKSKKGYDINKLLRVSCIANISSELKLLFRLINSILGAIQIIRDTFLVLF